MCDDVRILLELERLPSIPEHLYAVFARMSVCSGQIECAEFALSDQMAGRSNYLVIEFSQSQSIASGC
jgi:hypothetical protein